jgi:ubiquinone/menaquinone biosynthesis C-methylase UbiE
LFLVMNEKAESHRHFVPAAGRDLFLPLYDPLTKLLGADRARQALIDQADLLPGQNVLDVGCGTGTLVLQIRRSFPGVEVVGLDPDPKALARAKRKAERQGAAVRFDQGFADALPYPDSSFDRVFSSVMFHHLESAEKEKMLREVRRVLKPGGSFHLMDFAGPDASDGFIARLLHTHGRLKDNAESRILEWLRQAGFGDPVRRGSGRLLLGRLAYYCAGR